MAEQHDPDLLQGTLDMLILKTVALEPIHGYGISPAHSAGYKRRFASSPGLTLSRFVSPRAERLDRI